MNNPIRMKHDTTASHVLVVDDHASARESMAEVLRGAGHTVTVASSGAEALKRTETATFDCIVTDLKMPGMNGLEFIGQLERRRQDATIVMVTAHASVETAVEAMRHGAFDYIEKPFDADKLEDLVARASRHGKLVSEPTPTEEPEMIGSSEPMRRLRERVAQVAPTVETVLILGESGTGKELVARSVHAHSQRCRGPLISLNCPVLSANLMESELFGHERGAFTGAETERLGRFERARGGSILLDEVTEIDLGLQAKLLRVLQERCFERVGSSETVDADVRVLATTNRDLAGEVAEGRFREDLYYRLAVLPLNVPALRERRSDIPELIEHFRDRCAVRLGQEPAELDVAAAELLTAHDWPGNVRELENIITRACVLGGSAPVTADEIRRWLLPGSSSPTQPEIPIGLSLEAMERKLIEATLTHYEGHRARTAKALGIGVRTLSGKLRQYGYAPREKSFSRAG